eukprot:1403266-Prymnesium_polylepis.1
MQPRPMECRWNIGAKGEERNAAVHCVGRRARVAASHTFGSARSRFTHVGPRRPARRADAREGVPRGVSVCAITITITMRSLLMKGWVW